jgi:hypothetical protein
MEEEIFAQAEAAKEARRKRQRARRDEKKKNFIRLKVNVGGLPDHAQIEPIEIPCGEGRQLIKWLALTVTQRLSNSKPSGAQRARETNKLHARGGFAVPGEVLDSKGELIDPQLPINEVFKNGDECFVSFGAKFATDCKVAANIASFGIPSQYMSPFAQRAFYPNTSESFKQYDALKERVEIEKKEEASLVSRWESKIAQKPSHEEVMAAHFRLVMVDNAGFDDDDASAATLRELNVDEIWSRMNMVKLGEVPKEQADQLKSTLVDWIELADNVFKYYTALEVGPPGSVATMSRSELAAFINGCGVFKNHTRMADVVDMVFDEANDEMLAVSTVGKRVVVGQDDENPDEELMRYEFIECLVKLSQIRFSAEGEQLEDMPPDQYREHRLNSMRKGETRMRPPGGGKSLAVHDCKYTLSETLHRLMEKHVKPVFDNQSTDNEVRKGLGDEAVQALFQKHLTELMVVYKYYACQDVVDAANHELDPAMEEAAEIHSTGFCGCGRKGDFGCKQHKCGKCCDGHGCGIHVGGLKAQQMNDEELEVAVGKKRDAALQKAKVEAAEKRAEQAKALAEKAKVEKKETEAAARPTMCLLEFQSLVQDSGLSMSDEDRKKLQERNAKLALIERRKRFARGMGLQELEEQEKGLQSNHLWHDLTELEIRQAFSCAQSDGDESVEDSSELVFAEFVESVAYVATMKWELKTMKFLDKLKLAIDAIVGCAGLIPLARKKELLPDVDWDNYSGPDKRQTPKKEQRPSHTGLPPISPITTGKLPPSRNGPVSPTHSVTSEMSTDSMDSNLSTTDSVVSIGTSWSSPVRMRKRAQPRRLPGFHSASSSSFSQQKQSHSRKCQVDELRTAMSNVTIERMAKPPGSSTGDYIVATAGGSDQQLRYKKYLSSARSGNWKGEGSTYSATDSWHKGRWSSGEEAKRNSLTGVTLDPLGTSEGGQTDEIAPGGAEGVKTAF